MENIRWNEEEEEEEEQAFPRTFLKSAYNINSFKPLLPLPLEIYR